MKRCGNFVVVCFVQGFDESTYDLGENEDVVGEKALEESTNDFGEDEHGDGKEVLEAEDNVEYVSELEDSIDKEENQILMVWWMY